MLVECKRLVKDMKAAAGQVRSYALWVLPAYYVITDARTVSIWDFQGAIAPDVEVLTLQQAELADRFDDLYARLNPRAATAARQNKVDRLKPPPDARCRQCELERSAECPHAVALPLLP